jgi:hypothetical protein
MEVNGGLVKQKAHKLDILKKTVTFPVVRKLNPGYIDERVSTLPRIASAMRLSNHGASERWDSSTEQAGVALKSRKISAEAWR